MKDTRKKKMFNFRLQNTLAAALWSHVLSMFVECVSVPSSMGHSSYMFEIEIWKNMIDEYHRRLRTIFGCT
jgi:hypothetical protein